MSRLRSLAVLSALLLAACGSCDKRAEEGDAAKDDDDEEQKAVVGTLEGTVRLAEGAEPPQYRPSDLGRGPGRPKASEGCPPLKKSDMQPVQLGKGRGASNVLVSVTEFDVAPPHEPQEHRVLIEDCRLTPAVVAATRGDSLVVENKSEYPFLPTLGKSPFMQALLEGQTRTMKLSGGGVQPLTCAFAATCGRSDVIVQFHPVHGVTAEGGRFELDNVPPGEVAVHAWHPLLQEAKKTVTVTEGETTKVELVVEPAERAEPAADGGTAEADGGTDQAGQGQGEQDPILQ